MTALPEPRPLLYLCPDSRDSEGLSSVLTGLSYGVDTVRTAPEAIEALVHGDYALALIDAAMVRADTSLLPALASVQSRTAFLLTGDADTVQAVASVATQERCGLLAKPVAPQTAAMALRAAVLDTAARRRQQAASHPGCLGPVAVRPVGHSPAVERLRELGERLAHVDDFVLLIGEAGTGRTALAHWIHTRSARRDRPMIAVPCAGLRAEQLESALFGAPPNPRQGRERRAPGALELADGGAVVLQSIERLPQAIQARLLRFLECGELLLAPGGLLCRVDVRVFATAAPTLVDHVTEEAFRRSVYYRLAGVSLHVPPLRDRVGDIADLLRFFLGESPGPRRLSGIEAPALTVLHRYDWPGNVRELRNLAERATIVCAGSQITPGDLPLLGLDPARLPGGDAFPAELTLRRVEQLHIERVLRDCGGNRSRAAQVLGITTRTLYNKLRRYRIEHQDAFDANA